MSGKKWILLAEDDANDAELILRALSALEAPEDVIVVRDGAEVLDCLLRRGAFAGRNADHPTVVLLDLKMPKMNGLEALRLIKGDPRLRKIPVVMFTSSREDSDVARSYEFGANAYVVKPVDFKHYNKVVKELGEYWVHVNEPSPLQSDIEVLRTTHLTNAT